MVDRDTMYMSRSPPPGIQEAKSPPSESVRPGCGVRRRLPTALGTEEEMDLPNLEPKDVKVELWAGAVLTCSSLNELSPLIRSAEGRHHDLIEPPGRQRGQPVMSHLAAQRDRRENPRVVEEQSHLENCHFYN